MISNIPRCNQDVENMLASYLKDNGNAHWAEALNDIQEQKNSRFHRVIKMSPYEALFGRPFRRGLESLQLPEDVLEGLVSEEDVQELIDTMVVGTDEDAIGGVGTEADGDVGGAEGHDEAQEETHEPTGEAGLVEEESEEDEDQHVIPEDVHSIADLTNQIPVEPLPDTCSSCEMPVPLPEVYLCTSCTAVLHWQCGFPITAGDGVLCQICHGRAQTVRNRAEARKGQIAAATAMKEKTAALLDPINVGDSVLVPVPRVDRGPADPPNLMGVVIEIKNDVYLVGTRGGVLKVSKPKLENMIELYTNW